jgi:hypothetical protein
MQIRREYGIEKVQISRADVGVIGYLNVFATDTRQQ